MPSVTTIIGGGIPKPALAPWNAKMVATFAVEHKEKWTALDDADAIDMLKRSPFRHTRKRADEGTLVHQALEAYVSGEEEVIIPPEEIGLKGQYNGALQFLREMEVEIEHAEATVFSRTHGYAGTSDISARSSCRRRCRKAGSGRSMDYKTGKAIYRSTPSSSELMPVRGLHRSEGWDRGTNRAGRLPDRRPPKRRGGLEAAIYEPTQELSKSSWRPRSCPSGRRCSAAWRSDGLTSGPG